jgi:hypothetical protein
VVVGMIAMIVVVGMIAMIVVVGMIMMVCCSYDNNDLYSVSLTGQCYPCPLTVDVKCFCGHTVLNLPCGLEKTTKPPKCHELCK